MTAIELIQKEREKQISKGYDTDHDDEHVNHELHYALGAYSTISILQRTSPHMINNDFINFIGNKMYFFEQKTFKPSDDPIQNLVIAGAFLVAEIERLQRQNDS